MDIGGYFPGQQISGLPGLRELSFWQRLFLRSRLRGERIYRAPDASFQGLPWNVVLGVINGRIYKISAQFLGSRGSLTGALAGSLFMECFMRLSDQFGKASVSEDGSMAKWQTPFGNAVLDSGERLGQAYVNLQLTSPAIIQGHVKRSDSVQHTLPIVRPARPPKVAACLSVIEAKLTKRRLSDSEAEQTECLCGALLQKALGDERLVIRLVNPRMA